MESRARFKVAKDFMLHVKHPSVWGVMYDMYYREAVIDNVLESLPGLREEDEELYGTVSIRGTRFNWYINDNPPSGDEEDWVQLELWVESKESEAPNGLANVGGMAWTREDWTRAAGILLMEVRPRRERLEPFVKLADLINHVHTLVDRGFKNIEMRLNFLGDNSTQGRNVFYERLRHVLEHSRFYVIAAIEDKDYKICGIKTAFNRRIVTIWF